VHFFSTQANGGCAWYVPVNRTIFDSVFVVWMHTNTRKRSRSSSSGRVGGMTIVLSRCRKRAKTAVSRRRKNGRRATTTTERRRYYVVVVVVVVAESKRQEDSNALCCCRTYVRTVVEVEKQEKLGKKKKRIYKYLADGRVYIGRSAVLLYVRSAVNRGSARHSTRRPAAIGRFYIDRGTRPIRRRYFEIRWAARE